MPPLGAVLADHPVLSPTETPEALAERLRAFLEAHANGAVLEDGKPLFELATTQHKVTADHGRCTLLLWSGERNLVRTVVAASERNGCLRLTTKRLGQVQTKMLVIASEAPQRVAGRREPARKGYLRLLQRVLARTFPEYQAEGFRAAMDLERSFGAAYARGSLVRGNEAWAVIGVGAAESQSITDGILTLGILWLHHCRERSDGRQLYKGLRVVVPRGAATLTLARMPWLNSSAAQWELFELEEKTEELTARDPADQGNLRNRLVHQPDLRAAQERFAAAIDEVMSLVPPGEAHRVEQRLRSSSELAFLLHGFAFAHARVSFAPASFAHTLEVTVGVGAGETLLTPERREDIRGLVAELFLRRNPNATQGGRKLRPQGPGRGIGAFTGRPAHGRLGSGGTGEAQCGSGIGRLEMRERALAARQDPLFRASPERWLESVLRENLAPLTRSLAPVPGGRRTSADRFANEVDPDTIGNREAEADGGVRWGSQRRGLGETPMIPRFDPRFVYAQVPAIAGAGDRGMLDLLGMTEDGRLAVLEIKASDDLQLALQGLDYWIRVRHHCAETMNAGTDRMPGPNDLQRHGYFRDVQLSPLPPRLYLVAPALQIHPATETVLRYLSPRVEWTLLALDERWRQEVRVVWRKSGGSGR